MLWTAFISLLHRNRRIVRQPKEELEPTSSGAMAALDLPALALFRELQPEDRRKSRGGKGKGKGKDNRCAARAHPLSVDEIGGPKKHLTVNKTLLDTI